ncbi:PDR/VanB family oxidoreductase [Roseobacter sp. MH60115]|uniref:PDR/VanB family oxidoreductase n=1 Tax=Roseobacter sp. MH60115 TaxID=2785324 RepID=UPI0018A2D1F6|nr:PDR/VanB family oxidoreductase [Roseobacter sp. MH60115]
MENLLEVKVAERLEDRGNILRLKLVGKEDTPLPPFEAGAHLDIQVAHNGTDLWRQYSLCGDPSEHGAYQLGILKDQNSRGGSVALHEVAQQGAELRISSPRNHFPLDETANHSVLLGGGIGITPILAMAHRLHHLGRRFELHYCTRSKGLTAFLDILADLPFREAITLHHDDDGTQYDLTTLPKPDDGVRIYVCGPTGFMEWIIEGARAQGHAEDHIHREYFNADVDVTGDSFEVEARASGVTVTVGPEETIVAALAREGIEVEVRCEEGVCGTCILDVLEGTPDHRDHFLTDDEKAENTEMTTCCSRAKSARLVLDI